jgi:hypothetical protein
MSVLTAFQLTSPATQSAAPFMMGHVFKRGDVPAGSYLKLDISNYAVTPLRLWNDGSLKHCAIMGRVPLTANVPKQVNLSVSGTPNAALTALTATDIRNAAPTASWSGNFAGTNLTVTLASLLATPKRTFISTPEMVECRYAAKVPGDASMYVTFDVRLYANGLLWVRVSAGNGYLNGSENITKSYIPTVIIGTTTVWNFGGVVFNHWPRTRYDHQAFIGTDPQVIPRHDTGYLNRTMLVPNYWKVGPTQAQIDAWIPYGQYTPDTVLAYTPYMGNGGAQAQIGLLPKWDALYFTSQGHPTLYKAVVAHARAINVYGIVYPDANTLDPIRISDFATWSFLGDGGSGSTDLTSYLQNGNRLYWDCAHFPSVGYLAYILTADYYYMESCAYNTLACYLVPSSAFGPGTARKISGQNRGQAWTYRSVSQSAAIYPSAVASAAAVFSDHALWLKTDAQTKASYYTTPSWPGQYIGYTDSYFDRNSNHGSIVADGQIACGTAPWEHHFYTASVGHAYDIEPYDTAGMASLMAFRDYLDGAPVWIMGGTGPNEYNFGYGSNYTVSIRMPTPTPNPEDAVPHTKYMATDPGVIFADTFGTVSGAILPNATTNQLMADPVGGPPSNTTGYFANLYPALAAAVDHGKPGAAAAFGRLIGADNFTDVSTADYAGDPMWGIMPRSYSQPALLFTPTTSNAIVPTPGPSLVMDTVSLLGSGALVMDTYRGLGIPASDIPTGFPVPPFLLNDIAVTDPAGTEYRVDLAVPAGITLMMGNHSDFEAFGNDGIYNTTQVVYKNGVGDSGTAQFAINASAVSTVTGVTVSPSAASASQVFTASVAGTNSPSQQVTWSRSGTAGSINAATGAFLAPGQTNAIQVITITATSVQDGSKTGTATVTIAALVAATVTGVTVAPATPTVTGSAQQQFSAGVAGTNGPSQAVTWSSTIGSINSAGLFTAPATTSVTQSGTVTATSVLDPTKSGTANVTIPAAGVIAPTVSSVSVTPPTATIAAGDTRQYSASVIGANNPSQAVVWDATAGFIDANGLFTPPSATLSVQTITIIATSSLDATKSGTAVIQVDALPGDVVVGNGNMLEVAADGTIVDPLNSNYYMRGTEYYISKDPDSIMLYGLDLTNYLARAGHNISIVAVEAVPTSVTVSRAATVQGAQLVVQLTGGVGALTASLDAAARCTYRFTMSNGDVDDFTFWLDIIDH